MLLLSDPRIYLKSSLSCFRIKPIISWKMKYVSMACLDFVNTKGNAKYKFLSWHVKSIKNAKALKPA